MLLPVHLLVAHGAVLGFFKLFLLVKGKSQALIARKVWVRLLPTLEADDLVADWALDLLLVETDCNGDSVAVRDWAFAIQGTA